MWSDGSPPDYAIRVYCICNKNKLCYLNFNLFIIFRSWVLNRFQQPSQKILMPADHVLAQGPGARVNPTLRVKTPRGSPPSMVLVAAVAALPGAPPWRDARAVKILEAAHRVHLENLGCWKLLDPGVKVMLVRRRVEH